MHPHNHLQAQWSIRKIHRTQHVVILMSTMNYSKRIQMESVKEKSAWNKALRSQVQASKSSLPVESPITNFSGIKLGQHMCIPRKLIRDAVPKGPPCPPPLSWSCGHPLPSTGQKPRLPESIQRKSHCSSGTMSHSKVLCQCRQLLIVEVPRCQQKHCKQAFLQKAVMGLLS